MKSFPYEVSEQPPAPYVDVEIKPSFSTMSPLRYRAKVDSGAAMTVIPSSLIDQWKLKPFGVVVVRSYNGQASMRPTYLIDLEVGNKQFTQLEVTLSLRTNVLLGRDVLNYLRIVLNGPDQITEILD